MEKGMKESNIEGIANHDDPESFANAREGGGEALTEARAGGGLSREIRHFGLPDAIDPDGRQHERHRHCEMPVGPARSQTPHTHGISMRENREVPQSLAADGAAGRIGKAEGRTPMMHDSGKSDRSIVPA